MNFVKSEPGMDPLVVSAWFAATPAKTFAAWTQPELVMKWFGEAPNTLHSANIDLRAGGAWRFVLFADDQKSVGFEGHYLTIAPGEKLVFTWAHVTILKDGTRDETPTSKVDVSFTAEGTGTAVDLVHSAISNEPSRRGIGSGWENSFGALTNLLGED